MTLPAVDSWNIRGTEGPLYKVGPHCSSPGCARFADHAHHIVRRSQLGGDYAWVLIDGKLYANLTGLCAMHHDEVTGRVGGHRAAIRLEDSIFYWCSLAERNGAVEYLPFAPLEPQPPSPESLAQRTSHDPDSEHCPFCGQTKRRRASAGDAATGPRRRRKSWTIQVPEDAEDGAEILDTLIDDLALVLGVDPTGHGRYYVVVPVLAYAQQRKKDFVELDPGRRMSAKVRDSLGRWIASGKATRKERDEWGVIVTARKQANGELWSLHEPGLRLEALRVVAERLDRADGDWRVLCYSTPGTIMGDLDQKRQVQHRSRNEIAHIDGPEAQALGKIGRIDLLDPALVRSWKSRTKKR